MLQAILFPDKIRKNSTEMVNKNITTNLECAKLESGYSAEYNKFSLTNTIKVSQESYKSIRMKICLLIYQY
ncbi:MAG: hypothetical protein V4585_12950 [Bacteroidota bacterium]